MRKAPSAAVRRYCSGKVRASKGDSGGGGCFEEVEEEEEEEDEEKEEEEITASRFT